MADKPKVVVVGDIICDVWMYARLSDHNPENAGVVFARTDTFHHTLPGGAAHVALCLQQLGCAVQLFGCANSCDPKVAAVLNMLTELGVDCTHVARERDCITPVKSRLMSSDGRKILARIDGWENQDSTAALSSFNWLSFRKSLADAAIVVVADYDKGYLRSWRRELVRATRDMPVPLFVDCRVEHMQDYRGATLLKVNAVANDAFMAMRGCSIVKAHIAGETGVDCVVVTHGTKGVEWSFKEHGRASTPVTDIVGERDGTSPAVGAGDAFMAGLAACVATRATTLPKLSPTDIQNAVNCAINVSAARLRTLEPRLTPSLLPLVFPERTISSYDAAALAQKARTEGKRVVFTNGCFDLFHSGHLYSLELAKAHGDLLIVGVDSDANVSRLKGPSRPIQEYRSRSLLVGSVRVVDAVVPIFDDNHLASLIEYIKPDVLVKGGDYEVGDIIGADAVTANGGRVVILPRLEGYSTTDTIKTILETVGPNDV